MADCGASLQAVINAAAAGATLNLYGCVYTAGATVNKALTIRGAQITVPANTTALTITANDVVLDGLKIAGAQHVSAVATERGIYASAAITRLTITNNEISNFGNAGIWLDNATVITVRCNYIHDIYDTGIKVVAGTGTVENNTLRNMGVSVTVPAGVTAQNNTTSGITGPPGSTDPAWAIALRAAFSGITYTDTTLAPGSYTGVQINAAIKAMGSGSDATHHKRLIVRNSTITLTGDLGINFRDNGGSNQTLDMTGSTIYLNTNGSSTLSSALFFQGNNHITVRGGLIIGQNSATGTTGADSQVDESCSGAYIRSGCTYIELDNVSMDMLMGFSAITSHDGGGSIPNYVWVHDSPLMRGGEMGPCVVAGSHVLYERLHVEDCIWYVFNIEPDNTSDTCTDLMWKDNTVAGWGWRPEPHMDRWFIVTDMGATIERIWVVNNTITEGAHWGGPPLYCQAPGANYKKDIVITGNVSQVPYTGSSDIMNFNNVYNLTVTGNTQIRPNHDPLVDTDTNPSGTHVIAPNTT